MELTEAISLIRPSVVQIRLMNLSKRSHAKTLVVGTGFIINEDGHVLTAKHVTQAAQGLMNEVPGMRLTVGLAVPNLTTPQLTMRGNFELVEAVTVEEDTRHDLSLLQMRPNPFQSGRERGVFRTPDGQMGVNADFAVADIAAGVPQDGDAIAVSGYPLDEPALITTSGHLASVFGIDIAEVSPPGASPGFTVPDSADSYLADVAVNPGNSGGPIYSVATAEVIGVVVAFRVAQAQIGQANPFAYNSGLSVVVPIRYGQHLVDRHTS